MSVFFFLNRGRYAHTSTEGGRLEIDLLASGWLVELLASQTRLASSPPTRIILPSAQTPSSPSVESS